MIDIIKKMYKEKKLIKVCSFIIALLLLTFCQSKTPKINNSNIKSILFTEDTEAFANIPYNIMPAPKTYVVPDSGTYDISTLGATPSDDLTILIYNGRTNITFTGSRTGTGFTYIILNGTADVTLNSLNIVNNNSTYPFIVANGGAASIGTVTIRGTNTIKNNTTSNLPLISATTSSNLIVKGFTAGSRANYLNATGYNTIIGSYQENAGNIDISDISITVNNISRAGIGTVEGTTKNITAKNVELKNTNTFYAAIGSFNGSLGDINVDNCTINAIGINTGIGPYCNNNTNKSAIANSITATNTMITSSGDMSVGVGCYYYDGLGTKITDYISTTGVTILATGLITTGIGGASSSSTNPELAVAGDISSKDTIINAEVSIGTGIGSYRGNNGLINVQNAKIHCNTYYQIGIGSSIGTSGNITVENAEISVRDNSIYNRIGIGTYKSISGSNIYLLGNIDIDNFPIYSGFDQTTTYGNIYINSGNSIHVVDNMRVPIPVMTKDPMNDAGETLHYYSLANIDALEENIAAYQTYPGYTYIANKSTNANPLFNSFIGVYLPDRFLITTISPTHGSLIYPSVKEITLTFDKNIQFNPTLTNIYQVYKVGSASPIAQNSPTISDNILTLHLLDSLEPKTTYTIIADKGIVQDTTIGYIKNMPLTSEQYTFSTRPLGSLHLVTPSRMSFGEVSIMSSTQFYQVNLESLDKSLSVLDDREKRGPWKLSVKIRESLHNEDYTSILPSVFIYRRNNTSLVLSDLDTKIYEATNSNDEYFSISSTWYNDENDGLFLEIRPGQAKIGEYSTTLEWTLADAP